MSIAWRKVAGDARRNGLALALVGLVIAAGVAGVVAALDAQSILRREIAASYLGSRSPDVALWFDRAGEAAAAEVARHPEVEAVEPRRVVTTRVAARDGTWLPMRVVILPDIDSQSVGRVHRHGGEPTREGLWIEQSGRGLLEGDRLAVRTPTGATVNVERAGYVHDAAVAPSQQERLVYAFAMRATAVALQQNPEPDQLWVRLKTRGDRSDAARVAAELRDALAAKGLRPLRVEALPDAHPHAALMGGMLRVLGMLSAVAFACAACLAGYLVSAWTRREVRLVGVLKAIGARPRQVAAQYAALALPLLAASTAAGVATGATLALALVRYYAASLNIDVADFAVPASLRLAEVATTFAVATLAMAWPIVRASRMTVREALQDAGLAAPLGVGVRLAKGLSSPGGVRATYAMRNAFRRPGRLVLVVAALACGAAIVLTTYSNYESLMSVIDRNLESQGHDVEAFLARAVPAAALEEAARKAPGIVQAEAWRRAGVSVASADPVAAITGTKRVTLHGYPADSRLFRLAVREGRAPAAADEILMTRTMREPYPDLRIGEPFELQFRDRRATVHVVGIVEEIGSPAFYASFAAYEAVTGQGDASAVLRAKAGGEGVGAAAAAIDAALLAAQMPPTQVITRAMFRDALDEHFNVVGDVLRIAGLGAALVGALVLAAGTAFNVLERRREIGVLRALGAGPGAISAMLLAEAVAIALLGTLLAVALSLVITGLMNGAAERSLLRVAVPMRFSLEGLAIVAAGSAVVVAAVWATLRVALRRSVHETLSYEG